VNTVGEHRSQLFTLRLWTEQTDPDTNDIRFKVQHVLSGDVRYARSWADVMEFVMMSFQEHELETQTRKEDPE
jgi:hypothetical protein